MNHHTHKYGLRSTLWENENRRLVRLVPVVADPHVYDELNV